MSSGNEKKVRNFDFVERFIEVCGSSQPADIKRLLDISYQAAKNYLSGRLPDSNVLLVIAERTPYSIHWLLTGQGDKFIKIPENEDALLLSGKFREFVRRESREVFSEMLSVPQEIAQSTSVVVPVEKIMKEKVMDESTTFSGKKQ